jgi:hypothetical protein
MNIALTKGGALLHETRYATYAWQNLQKSKPYASHPMKQAVIAPSMMYLLYPLQGELEGYPRDEFIKDLINEVGHPTRISGY